ncbi:hypothetical protein AB0M72_07155 [Nocardiopsis dassonvillei]
MILTGAQIQRDMERGRIILSPFQSSAVNPNSYNYRLGSTIKLPADDGEFISQKLPESGWVLLPRQMYLGHTFEVIGSPVYAMSLIGRSSIGRLGLFVQVSANLGHTTSCHRWTLEMVAARPIRVYPEMVIGQVSFWHNEGPLVPRPSAYAALNEPAESRLEGAR